MILFLAIMLNLITRTTPLRSHQNLFYSRRTALSKMGKRNDFCRYYSNSGAQDSDDSEDVTKIGTSEANSAFRPSSHSLQDNRLKHRLQNSLPLTGVVSGQYRDTDHIEMLGLLGYDFLWADAEHSSAGPDDIASMIIAAERRGLPTIVRIGYGYQNIHPFLHNQYIKFTTLN